MLFLDSGTNVHLPTNTITATKPGTVQYCNYIVEGILHVPFKLLGAAGGDKTTQYFGTAASTASMKSTYPYTHTTCTPIYNY